MSRQFIKTEDGLEQVAKPLVKVYDTMNDFLTALPNLEENEIVTTEFTGGTEDVMLNFEELRAEINDIKKVIPDDAAEDNQVLSASSVNALIPTFTLSGTTLTITLPA